MESKNVPIEVEIRNFRHKLKDFIINNAGNLNVYEVERILCDTRDDLIICAVKNTSANSCEGILCGYRSKREKW